LLQLIILIMYLSDNMGFIGSAGVLLTVTMYGLRDIHANLTSSLFLLFCPRFKTGDSIKIKSGLENDSGIDEQVTLHFITHGISDSMFEYERSSSSPSKPPAVYFIPNNVLVNQCTYITI